MQKSFKFIRFKMILDAITSSPLNVVFTIVIGIGLAYLYYRKPSSSSSPSSSSRTFPNSNNNQSTIGVGGGLIDPELQRAIAQIERQERDMIRREQDEAYQKSLKLDKEKQLKRQEDSRIKEEKEKTEKESLERQERLHNSLIKLKYEILDKLPLAPSNQKESDIVKLLFKLPDGSRIKRNFRKDDKVKYLYWYVFSQTNAPLQFKMTTNFPKRDLPGRPPIPEDFLEDKSVKGTNSVEPNCEQTLMEASLTETQTIFVYDLEA